MRDGNLTQDDIEFLSHDFGCLPDDAMSYRQAKGCWPWDSPEMTNRGGDGRKPVPPSSEPDLQPMGAPVAGQVGEPWRERCAAELVGMDVAELPYLPFLGLQGYIVRGWTTLIAGYPKTGKTELVTRLCADWQGERILYATEEPESIWAARLSSLQGRREHMRLLFALGMEPRDLLARIGSGPETVVVVDTVRNLFGLRDETDNSEVARVLSPYISACRGGGKTLLLMHRLRKGGGEHGEGITGGHAFLGIVDAALEVLREANLGESRRRIRGWGRVVPIPELVYSLAEDGTMTALGSPADVSLSAVRQRALEVLGDDWQAIAQVLDGLGEPRPSRPHLRQALNDLVRDGTAEPEPKDDRPGATYLYRRLQPVLQRGLPIVAGQVGGRQDAA